MQVMAQWIPEYCIVCDKQSVAGSMYCSEKCRYAEQQRIYNESAKKQHSSHHSRSSSQESDSSLDSSDDDADLSGFTLSSGGRAAATNHSHIEKKKKQQQPKKKEKNFLYASPRLNPQKNLKSSPSLSPLMIPTVVTPEVINAEQMSAQSVNTYKRWMLNNES